MTKGTRFKWALLGLMGCAEAVQRDDPGNHDTDAESPAWSTAFAPHGASVVVWFDGHPLAPDTVLDLGDTPSGTWEDLSFLVQNTGNEPVTLAGIALDETDTYRATVEPTRIQSGATTAFTLGFHAIDLGHVDVEATLDLVGADDVTFAAKSHIGETRIDLSTLETDYGLGPVPEVHVRPGLDSALSAILDQVEAGDEPICPSCDLKGDSIRVVVKLDAFRADTVVAEILTLGGDVTSRSGGDRLAAWIPLLALEDVAGQNGVHRVELPQRPTPTVAPASKIDNVAAWIGASHDASGTTVGIIDVDFTNYATHVGGALPADVTHVSYTADGGGMPDSVSLNHGTQVAEVIGDIASNVDHMVLAQVATDVDVRDAVEDLVTLHQVDVINMSLSFFEGPGDGSGYLNDIVDYAASQGVLWVNSAGNYKKGHWGADTTSSSWLTIGSDTYLKWGTASPYQVNVMPYCLPEGTVISGFLRWDDWEQADVDYDLYVAKWEPNIGLWTPMGPLDGAVGGTNPQTGAEGEAPYESVTFTTNEPCVGDSGEDDIKWGFMVRKGAGAETNHRVELFARALSGDLDFRDLGTYHTDHSITIPGDNPNAMAVAAIDANTEVAEDYSSMGPTNGPGGTTLGGLTDKPDISGYADVDVHTQDASADQDGVFSGTSAAAPHVAGTALVLKSANPEMTPAQIRAWLDSYAEDEGAVGADSTYGIGSVILGAAPSALWLNKPIVGVTTQKLTKGATYVFVAGPDSSTSNYTWTLGGSPTWRSASGSNNRVIWARWDSVGSYSVAVSASGVAGSATASVVTSELQISDADWVVCDDDLWGAEFDLAGTSTATRYGIYYRTSFQTGTRWRLHSVVQGLESAQTFRDCGGPGWDPNAATLVYYVVEAEDDPDEDGLGSGYELRVLCTDPDGCDVGVAGDGDSDNDGLPDYWDTNSDGDVPEVPDSAENFDNTTGLDTLTNAEEANQWGSVTYDACRHGSSDPWAYDTDGDLRMDDADDFPLDRSAWRDADCDGNSDYALIGTSTSRPKVVHVAPAYLSALSGDTGEMSDIGATDTGDIGEIADPAGGADTGAKADTGDTGGWE